MRTITPGERAAVIEVRECAGLIRGICKSPRYLGQVQIFTLLTFLIRHEQHGSMAWYNLQALRSVHDLSLYDDLEGNSMV